MILAVKLNYTSGPSNVVALIECNGQTPPNANALWEEFYEERPEPDSDSEFADFLERRGFKMLDFATDNIEVDA